jgi:tRNA threonylcarbamoyladenosine biosynthesis protein TsaE
MFITQKPYSRGQTPQPIQETALDLLFSWYNLSEREWMAQMEKTLKINSINDMNQLAESIAKRLTKGSVIGLAGDLGSGKTTFAKALARHLGVFSTVNSPTFALLKIYQGQLPFYHIDVYRLEQSHYDPALDDYIYGDGVCVIEWYPIILTQLPEERLTLDIVITGPTSRILTIKGNGRYEKIVETLGD